MDILGYLWQIGLAINAVAITVIVLIGLFVLAKNLPKRRRR